MDNLYLHGLSNRENRIIFDYKHQDLQLDFQIISNLFMRELYFYLGDYLKCLKTDMIAKLPYKDEGFY